MPNSRWTISERAAAGLAALLLCAGVRTAEADGGEAWRADASLEAWLYGDAYRLTSPAPLPQKQYHAEGRLDLTLRRDALRVELAPRLNWLRACPPSGADCRSDGQASLNQGYFSLASGGEQLAAGREKFSWGPANFRSPSNPFYFDSGRTNPLADTPGIDLARWTHSAGAWRLTSAYVSDTRTLPQPRQRDTVLFKLDRQDDDSLASLVFSQARSQRLGPFLGAFAQYTPDDAWLLYGEASVQRREAATAARWLAGASYTSDAGRVWSAEYLFNGDNGAATLQADPAALRGRHYLWASVQSNPQELERYWRLEWTRNQDDRSQGWMLYGERRLLPRLSGFAMLILGEGGAGSELGGAYRSGVTLGLKLFLF
ncbi:hypothetical protein CR207_18340 [Chromobacterium violaceum]|uniref:hypothetical protein n=1 Tax=Chromobacterium violaceum TaxID=536 RepID=UPI000C127439|nr:hypothetical protein [Chromobacterium violaceum]ATP30180.1 hypothetical protein CRN81_18315 [Chromobacterium violaceum]ATP34086.1 hypothetical protein CR207_18340 [Chromobacterium violaceum]MBX9268310.1 hypothetical protein [Chromobacterium violaceum]